MKGIALKGAVNMPIKGPYPSEFSPEILAEHWECSIDLVNQYVSEGLLKREIKVGSKPKMKDPKTGKGVIWFGKIYYFTREEVKRFEQEHFTKSTNTSLDAPGTDHKNQPTSKVLPGESPKHYVARRKNEGISDSEIALELRESEIALSTIGMVFYPEEKALSDNTAFAKRAKVLIKMLDKTYRERIKKIFSEKEYLKWLGQS
jgi:hypothetical protein